MPINHPSPTKATVKELYGTALRCAFPDCVALLYRVDATGSTRTLNSRVAHIRARSAGGPRWDAEMAPEQNRAAENLVLLCIGHSYEIDDKQLETTYPTATIHEWKRVQIAEYDSAVAAAATGEVVGWSLTDEEADDAIEASERSTNIALQAQNIQIGGSGGYLGGGGGGGGVLLPGTVQPPPRIGVEGRGYIAGVDGAPGGYTTVAVDGKVILRAEGARGALAGSGNRMTSDRLVVSTLLIANHVTMMPHGLATIVDAGWGSTSVLNLPTPLTFPIFTAIEAGGAEAGEYTVIFELCAPTGEVRTSVSVALVVEQPGDLVRIQYVIGLSGDIDAFGLWRIVVRSEVAPLAALDVMVKRVGEAAT